MLAAGRMIALAVVGGRSLNARRVSDCPLVRHARDRRHPEVGGKNASLGELYSRLGEAGVPVPNGFALTAGAYRQALTEARAFPKMHVLLDLLDVTDVAG